jgi:hypothetical protein
MAKSSPLIDASAIRALIVRDRDLAVRVTPNARLAGMSIGSGNAGEPLLHLRITAPPEDGKANAAVIAMLAKALGLPKSALTVVRGHRSRNKIVQLKEQKDRQ